MSASRFAGSFDEAIVTRPEHQVDAPGSTEKIASAERAEESEKE